MKKVLVAAAVLAGGVMAQASVFDKAVFWFRGANDADGDGVFDGNKTEFRDALHENDSTYWAHDVRKYSKYNECKIRSEEVIEPFTGVSLGMRDCLYFDHPVDDLGQVTTQLLQLVNYKQYAPTNDVGWSLFMRFRPDKFKTCLTRYYQYWSTGCGGAYLRINPGTYGGGYYSLSFGSQGVSFGSTWDADHQLMLDKWADIVFTIKGKSFHAYTVRQGGKYEHDSATINYSGEWVNKTSDLEIGGHCDSMGMMYYGSIHDFAAWDRELTEAEAIEVLTYSGRNGAKIGVMNGNANELTGSSREVTANAAGSWRDSAATIAAGEKYAVKFQMTEDNPGANQVLLVSTLTDSAAGELNVKVNGTDAGKMKVKAGTTSMFLVRSANLVQGENTVELSAAANFVGTVKFDSLMIDGGWQLGDVDKTQEGYNSKPKNFFVNSWTNETKNLLTTLMCGDKQSNTNLIMYFTIPEEVRANVQRYRFTTAASCATEPAFKTEFPGYPEAFTYRVLVNDVEMGRFNVSTNAPWTTHVIDIPASAFGEVGQITLKLQSATPLWYDPAGYAELDPTTYKYGAYFWSMFDYFRLEPLRNPTGMAIVIR